MPVIIALIGSVVTFIFTLFLGIIASTLVGGLVGWTVGLVFPFVFDSLNKLTSLSLTPFEMGAMLGFVGSFFRSSRSAAGSKQK